ncbi:hypothetical protein ACFL2Q_08410 [Thermodesulfobacteriota bacterium]
MFDKAASVIIRVRPFESPEGSKPLEVEVSKQDCLGVDLASGRNVNLYVDESKLFPIFDNKTSGRGP